MSSGEESNSVDHDEVDTLLPEGPRDPEFRVAYQYRKLVKQYETTEVCAFVVLGPTIAAVAADGHSTMYVPIVPELSEIIM